MKSKLKVYRELKHKEELTDVEQWFMIMKNELSIISQVLVEESKCHISSKEAIKLIREELNNR